MSMENRGDFMIDFLILAAIAVIIQMIFFPPNLDPDPDYYCPPSDKS
jgi:hypothetical protein